MHPTVTGRCSSAWFVFMLAGLLVVSANCARFSGRPSFIVVLVDTLRADYLGCYGFQGPVSPNIDALARESYVFKNCYASAPWTKPSVASLFTSLNPMAHGVTNHEGAMWSEDEPDLEKGVLRLDALTLAERLKAEGYATGAFVANPWMSWQYGFDQGFDVYSSIASIIDPPADRVTLEATRWLESAGGREPYFLYLHLLDVHGPYNASDSTYELVRRSPSVQTDAVLSDAEWDVISATTMQAVWARDARGAKKPETRRLDTWRGRYAAEVRDLDDRLGPFLAKLKQEGYLDHAYLILISDHGEALHDHGNWDHGYSLFEDQVHVPMIIRPPGGLEATQEVPAVVGLVDLLPTLVAAGGASAENVEGKDLGSLIGRPGESGGSGIVFSGAARTNPLLYSVRAGTYKLIVNGKINRHALFDITKDPGEEDNIAPQAPQVVGELRAYLDKVIQGARARPLFEAETPSASIEGRELLRSLGYAN
ncbi:MAG TPA: sulfatase [Candidatus Eisenbacteria bacterium]|nr:sulfatase [Candidatus Eisenbacteria bacterium]